jgi:hypothetical protein
MITFSRRQARRLRGVFRRSVLGIGPRGALPPLVLRTGGSQLRAQYRYAGLAVEHAEPDGPYPAEAIALPLDALAAVEGHDSSSVLLEVVASERTVVRWEDHGIPQTREFVVPALATLAPFPEPPTHWQDSPPGLLTALAEASATSSDENTRYALSCLQLQARDEDHQVIATDGRQLLIQSGFRFPWSGDVLIRRSPIFACRALPREEPLELGKTETHVVLRVGPWSLFLEIPTDARFPAVERALPDPGSAATRLLLDPEDAAFLAQSLEKLPGADALNAPATVDLNGRVAVRAQSANQSQQVELILARSTSTGVPVRLHSNREFLARALGFGFTELEILDADTPVVCRDRTRVYGWQPLAKESALEPADGFTRIESALSSTEPARRPVETTNTRVPRNERRTQAGHDAGPPVSRSTVPVPDHGRAGSGLAALIQEAVVLHDALSEARMRTQRLIAALRRQRKQARLMSGALVALRQLRLQEVAP